MCLIEKYSRVRVGKNLSDKFPIRNCLKQGDALQQFFFNYALNYATWRVQVTQEGLKLNGTNQLLVYADDVNILGGGVHAIKENAEAFVVVSKETGLRENGDKTKYMAQSPDQNAGRNHTIKKDNSLFERVQEFKFGNKFNRSKFYSVRI